MPNIKSAKKRVKVIAKKTAENRIIKSALKTQLKKFDASLASEENVQKTYAETASKLDSAASKGIIHKNKANRQKARLAKKMQTAE